MKFFGIPSIEAIFESLFVSYLHDEVGNAALCTALHAPLGASSRANKTFKLLIDLEQSMHRQGWCRWRGQGHLHSWERRGHVSRTTCFWDSDIVSAASGKVGVESATLLSLHLVWLCVCIRCTMSVQCLHIESQFQHMFTSGVKKYEKGYSSGSKDWNLFTHQVHLF